MTVTSGFFNSVNGDRRYNALQVSELFDGLIEDGVYETLYNGFRVTPNSNGLAVQVDTGRAWFNHTWIKNDNLLVLPLSEPELLFDRIDTVVIEVNHTDNVRKSDIKVVKGTPSSNPEKPTLSNANGVYQHPLAYVTVRTDATAITKLDILNAVGTKACPFVTGVVSAMDISMFLDLWGAQYEVWVYRHANDLLDWLENFRASLEEETATHLAEKIADIYHIIKTLAVDHVIYYPLEDADDEPILDNYDREIIGGVKFSTGGVGEGCLCDDIYNVPVMSEEEINSIFSSE